MAPERFHPFRRLNFNDGPSSLLFQQLQVFMGIEESVVLGYLDINLFLRFPASFLAVPSLIPPPAPPSPTSSLGLSYAY